MTEQTDTIATVANMRRAETMGIRAYVLNLATGETYSATPGDYFLRGADEPLTDAEGDPMHLVTGEPATYRPLSLGEPDTYATSQIDRITTGEMAPLLDAVYRVKIEGYAGASGATKWMDITPAELAEFRSILARRTV